jgi:hypothetical protein
MPRGHVAGEMQKHPVTSRRARSADFRLRPARVCLTSLPDAVPTAMRWSARTSREPASSGPRCISRRVAVAAAGPSTLGLMTDFEATPLRPNSVYGATKAAASLMLLQAASVKVFLFRYFGSSRSSVTGSRRSG